MYLQSICKDPDSIIYIEASGKHAGQRVPLFPSHQYLNEKDNCRENE